jgi:hypothetical protein
MNHPVLRNREHPFDVRVHLLSRQAILRVVIANIETASQNNGLIDWMEFTSSIYLIIPFNLRNKSICTVVYMSER